MKSDEGDTQIDPTTGISRSDSPQPFNTFDRGFTNRKSMGQVPLIQSVIQPGYGLAAPKKAGVCSVIYRYLFFLINLLFVCAGVLAIGFGIYGVIRIKVDGIDDPILICTDPAFITLILGKPTFLFEPRSNHG